jgi:ribose transport system substrate-binding protein
MKRSKFKVVLAVAICAVMLSAVALTGCGNSTTQSGDTAEGNTAGDGGDTVQVSTSSGWQWGDAAWEAAVREKVEGTTLKIGFTPPAASEFYDIIMHGAYTMMDELHDRFGVNFEFEFVAPSEHDAVESQVATIENWVTKEFDAILVCTAGDFDSMNAVYEKAMNAGTAIYLFNMPAELWDADSINATSIIGYDNARQSGYLIGEYAAEKLNGEGKILFISGNDGHWTTSRRNGFMEAIDQYPGLEVVGEQRGEYVRDAGMEAAENLLQANPDVNFIYGENEEMAQGAVQAVEARGLKLWDGTDGIIVVGADGLKSGFEQIRSEGLTATVDVGSVDQGRESIKAIFMHELLGYSLDKVINVPTILVDKDNVSVPEAYVDWALATEENYN